MRYIEADIYEHNGVLLQAVRSTEYGCLDCSLFGECRNGQKLSKECLKLIGVMTHFIYLPKGIPELKKEETKMKIDFSKLPIGTRVWSFTKGWGTLENIHFNEPYPIKIRFDLTNLRDSCQNNGVFLGGDLQSLFLNSFEIPDSAYVSPVPRFNHGDIVKIIQFYDNFTYYRKFHSYSNDGRGLMIFYVEDGSKSDHFSNIAKYKYELVKAANDK